MKKIKSSNFILTVFISCLFFISCKKETEELFSPQTNTPQLKGYEVVFDNLEWQYDTDGIGEWMYMISPSRPELFESPFQRLEVRLKLDSSADWVRVRSFYQGSGDQFTYAVSVPSLLVYMWPIDHNMVGKKSSVKLLY